MKKDKRKSKEYKEALPVEIRVLFGRFSLFSILLIIFLGLIFPLLIIDRISLFSRIAILLVLGIFYVYMIIDVLRKKKNFTSTTFILFIALVVLAFVSSIVKMLI